MISIAGLLILSLRGTPASAQAESWNFNVAAGATQPVGRVADRLTTGWGLNLGAEREVGNGLDIRGEFDYYRLGVANQVLTSLQVPNGDARVFALTIGPRWRFPISGRVTGYAIAGAGLYRRRVEFTQATLAVVDIVDPWWGYVGPEIVPAHQVLASVTKNALGANVGGGVSIPIGKSGVEAFGEVRYHYANTSVTSTQMLPMSFGLRLMGRALNAP
jgi:opacity protein-like surface antigen